jgi:ribosomal protein L28
MAGRTVRHKHSGLWERKAPAKPRVFKVNIQKQTVFFIGKAEKILLCSKCLKRIRNYPGWKGYTVKTIKKEEKAPISSYKSE